MIITVNLYYTGTNGSAKKFAQEMESSGTADKIRAEKGNLRYEYFFPMMQTIATLREKYDLHMRVERFVSDEDYSEEKDRGFIRN